MRLPNTTPIAQAGFRVPDIEEYSVHLQREQIA